MSYEHLRDHCKTDGERRVIEALISEGSIIPATKKLGINPRNVTRPLARVKRRAERRGDSPDNDMHKPCAESFGVKRVSNYYDYESGELKRGWVISEPDKAKQAQDFIEALTSILEDREPCELIRLREKKQESELLTLYPLGDPHIGLYSYAEETGADFDCDIAETNLLTAMQLLVNRAPPSETAVILNLGDFFHADNMDNRTSRSGHALDVDSRYSRVCEIGLKIKISLIELALQKHKNVVVKNLIGNHDDHSSVWLGLALKSHFRKNPRVTVDTSPKKHWFFRFGKILIGSTHGDTVKPKDLLGIMATDAAQDWGETIYRYFYTGHIHSSNVEEFPGMLWESFRTLAAPDAWHSAGKYRSGRDMHALTFDKETGLEERHIKNIRSVEAQKCQQPKQ